MGEKFAQDMWRFIADETSIAAMLDAAAKGHPAIWPLLDTLESRFEKQLLSNKYPRDEICVLANNMIKQIMEHLGYEHCACGLCRNRRFFRSSGVYRKP